MFKNVFVGKNAKNQSERILIFGESHYEESGEINGTADVVESLAVCGNDAEKNTEFYKNIMKTFGYNISPEERVIFWNKVFCGNYVEELCGKGKDNTAKYHIAENREKYNDDLFRFVNENEIDVVFCFSRLVYNSLPCFTKGENEMKLVEHPQQYLNKFTYLPKCHHKKCTVQLRKRLTVYGLKHPSSYYNSELYYEAIKKEINI
ncbi:MAG: hypothetical protein IJ025_05180 [Clostridia bacterium]|nr:hypothetical protein [Clostridia bacterium]